MIYHLLRSGLFWAAAGLLALGLGFGAASAVGRDSAAALARHGAEAVGTVTGHREETRRRRVSNRWRTDHAWFVSVAFEAVTDEGAAQPIRVEHQVAESVHEELALGETLTVRYLPEDPEVVDLFPGETAGRAGGTGLLAKLLAGLGMVLGIGAAGRAALARRAEGAEA